MRPSIDDLVHKDYSLSTNIQLGEDRDTSIVRYDSETVFHTYDTNYRGISSLEREYSELLAINALILSLKAISCNYPNGCKSMGVAPYKLGIRKSEIYDTIRILRWRNWEYNDTLSGIWSVSKGSMKVCSLISWDTGLTKIELQFGEPNNGPVVYLLGTKKRSLGIDVNITKRWLVNQLATSDIWDKWDTLYRGSSGPIHHAYASLDDMRNYIRTL